MPIVLSVPDELRDRWKAKTSQLIYCGNPTLTITLGRLIPLPDDLEEWVKSTLRSDTSSAAEVQIGPMIRDETQNGWPMRLVDAFLKLEGKTQEVRLCAFYRFFEYGAFALAHAKTEAPLPGLFFEAVQIFRTAQPDWSSKIVALHQLWYGVERTS